MGTNVGRGLVLALVGLATGCQVYDASLIDAGTDAGEFRLVKDRAGGKGLKLHLHHCRHITVAVTYNGETIDRKFAPSATVARVKRWAAERKFGMTDEESGEHVLQIAGTHERPAPGTHIGVLANRKTCGLAFDLVADERVNGASEDRR